MAFYELYRLNTVLLLPRSGWIFKLQLFTGWIWAQPLGALQLAHLKWPETPSPWWRPEDSDPETVLYWCLRHENVKENPHISICTYKDICGCTYIFLKALPISVP